MQQKERRQIHQSPRQVTERENARPREELTQLRPIGERLATLRFWLAGTACKGSGANTRP